MPNFQRPSNLDALSAQTFDVVVIGAGMTGTGVALDAATRGLRVALLDAGDFAAGTSSKSSKMAHGGLRYLQQKEFRLVYENLRERQRLLQNAPHLIRPLPFLIPLFGKDRVMTKALVKGYASALRLYDLTGGWRIGQRYRKISATQARQHLPTLATENLAAGFIYMDARGDDARVALTLARSANDHGAVVANYVKAVGIEHDDAGRVTSVMAQDVLSGQTLRVATTSVVNASGVWADEIFAMAEHETSQRITPAKGVHVTVPSSRLPVDVAAVLTVPGGRRSIFVVPFEEAPYTFIGTTDTPYDGSLDTPDATPEDVAYLLDTVNAWTSSALTSADVTGVWAGLRPLLAPQGEKKVSERTADLSRRHQVTDSGDGVVHITGGKWTTYRQMAEDTVDELAHYFPRTPKVRTRRLALRGHGTWRPSGELDTYLYRRFGDDALTVLAMIEETPALGRTAIEGLPYLGAEFLFAVEHEMATSLLDLLTRRTRAHLMNAPATLAAAAAIAQLVAPTMGWDEADVAREVASYRQLCEREFAQAGLSL